MRSFAFGISANASKAVEIRRLITEENSGMKARVPIGCTGKQNFILFCAFLGFMIQAAHWQQHWKLQQYSTDSQQQQQETSIEQELNSVFQENEIFWQKVLRFWKEKRKYAKFLKRTIQHRWWSWSNLTLWTPFLLYAIFVLENSKSTGIKVKSEKNMKNWWFWNKKTNIVKEIQGRSDYCVMIFCLFWILSDL